MKTAQIPMKGVNHGTCERARCMNETLFVRRNCRQLTSAAAVATLRPLQDEMPHQNGKLVKMISCIWQVWQRNQKSNVDRLSQRHITNPTKHH